MKEGSDVNITEFGKGYSSYYLFITRALNAFQPGVQ